LPIIHRALKHSDIFQFRAPTGIGTYVIPFLLTQKKPGWIKYAGNWIQQNPPIGYSFQRWMLKHQSKFFVTINGHWPNQPQQCISFENPCLTEQECEDGMRCIDSKEYDSVLDFCFVGRLESAKGVHRIIEAFKDWHHERIGKIHLIGDGSERKAFELLVGDDKRFVFHGFIDRNKVAQILSQSHVFLFPSQSEGFPKAIGEAANYGCIVVATDVSCISHYIAHEECGYLIPESEATGKQLRLTIQQAMDNPNLRQMATNAHAVARKFTYDYYLNHIQKSIIEELGFH
jgi:Glycosyltransferase